MSRRKPKGRPIDGWLIVDKPPGMTSTDVVNRVKRIFDAQKAGHGGTLDPLATGVLPIAFGAATKTVPYVMDGTKIYHFTLKLGEARDTDDAEGQVIETSDVRPSDDQLKAVLPAFIGDIMQVPPIYSAIKIAGKALYKSARAGEEIEREPRFIRISQYDLLRWESPEIDFRVLCTKGTYVRTLAHDLGQKLGCGAHLSALRRIASGNLNVSRAVTLEQLQKMSTPEIEKVLIPAYEAAPSVAFG